MARTGTASALERVTRLVLENRRGAVALSLVHLALLLVFVVSQRYLHDEGIFSVDLARLAQHAPVPLLFFEKAKPVLMVIYAIPAALGLDAFLVLHAVLGAAAVFLASEAARRLGAEAPNLAGWMLACSSSFTIASSNGYPNSDGAFFVALFLFLYASERRTAAAVVLGMVPFVRSELASMAVVFLAWDLATRRDGRFLAGALAFPAIYGATGAVYHRDAFWLYNEFPNPGGLPAAVRTHAPPSALEALANLRGALLANAPVLAVFGVAAIARRDRALVPLVGSAIAAYAGMTLLQVLDVLGFDSSPRYYVAALPLLAVLASAALSPHRGERVTWAIAAALAIACATGGAGGAAAAVVVLVAVAIAWKREWLRASLALLVVASIPYLGWQLADDTVRERAQILAYEGLVEELRARGLYRGEELLIDAPIARYVRGDGVTRAQMLPNDAVVWETESYLNPRNGQREELLRAAARIGIVLVPDRHELRRDAVYALRDHERTQRWRDRLEAAGAVATRVRDRWVYRFESASTP